MSSPPLIPVYLNQRYVFDLLAMLQGGISTVSSVSRLTESEKSNAGQLKSSFGIADAISSLLKIDLSAQIEGKRAAKEVSSAKEERIHTPASLFYQLRSLLESRNELVSLTSGVLPEAGQLIEFSASLTRNPVVQTFETLSSLLEIIEEIEHLPDPSLPLHKQKKAHPLSQFLIAKQQLVMLLKHIRIGETIDLSAAGLAGGIEAVLTLEVPSLYDPTLSNLLDGKFTIVGKVIRSVAKSEVGINFLRKTPLAHLPEGVLVPLRDALAALATAQKMSLPELRWEVPGPAIHVLPVAIYA